MGAFKKDYEGIGEMLRAPYMVAAMRARGEKVEAQAVATAPDAPPIGVGYKEHFSVEAGVREGLKPRAFARVRNDSDHALAVEFGWGNTPRHRTLGKALDAAK